MALDVIGFERVKERYGDGESAPAVRVVFNGTPLEQLVGVGPDGEVEAAALEEHWARRQTGTIWSGEPYRFERRGGNDPTDGSVPVLNCGCGDFGCGGISVFIERSKKVVRWRGFRGAPGVGSKRAFTFDAEQYDAALRELIQSG